MGTTALITVVLPVYNGGSLIAESVRSVLNQDLKSFEFLICDDCSTDDSLAYLRASCGDIENVRIFTNTENQGLFKTLNRLVHQSSAPLIHIWSQDDVMKPNCLSSTLAFHNKHPQIGMSYSARDLIDGEGKLISVASEDGTPEIINKALYAKISSYWGCMAGNIANVTLTKKAFDTIGDFNVKMNVSGDFEYWTRIAQKYPIGYNKEANIFLRLHEGQLSQQFNSVAFRITEDIEIMQNLLKMAADEDYPKILLSWKWKTQTSFFNEYIYLLRNRQWHLAKQSYTSISEIASPNSLAFRWLIVKSMRILGKEIWFYKKVINTLN
jgi:glycosyltransferase involved in cell wall biosynthesis